MMRKANRLAAATALSLLLAAGPAQAVSYSGSLSYGDGTLQATAAWAASNTQLDWSVHWDIPQQEWVYTYDLQVPDGDISHATIETSDDISGVFGFVTNFDYENSSGLGLWTPSQGNSNPNMPSSIYGLKLDLDEDRTDIQIVIATERDPVIGDFYAKGGRGQGQGRPVETEFNSLWNSGLGSPDLDPTFNLLNPVIPDGHLLVPNHTSNGPPDDPNPPPELVPEPITAVALIGSLGGLGGYLRRRRRAD